MASIEYLVHINLSQNELQNAVVQNLSTAPSTPLAGQIYYNSTDGNIYVWDGIGTAWVDLTSQGSGSTNLGYTASPTDGTVTSSTGTDATIPLANGTNAGLLAPGDFTQLSNFADGDKGDITVSASGATWTIDADAVTYAKIQNVATANTLLGSTSAGGIVSELSAATVRTILNVADGANNYVHPNHTGHVTSTGDGATVVTVAAITGQTELAAGLASTDELLVSDAGVIKRMDISVLETYMQDNLTITTTLAGLTDTTIATLASGNILVYDGTDSWDNKVMSGDATIASTGALTIANNSVTFAKMQDVATGTIFYRKTAATGDPEVQTLATLKTDLGLIGSNSGDQTITLTGDVTGSGSGTFATTIAAGAVDYTMLSQTWIITQAEGIGANDNETSIPTSAAVKDYVDNAVTGALIYQGGYNASTDTPSLDDGTPIAGILQGHTYTVTTAGDFFTEAVEAGDMLIAEIDSPLVLADWTLVNKNIPDLGATGADGSVIRRKSQTCDADTSTTVTHNFNTRNVHVQVYETASPFAAVIAEVIMTTVDSITVNFNTAPTLAEYTIVVMG